MADFQWVLEVKGTPAKAGVEPGQGTKGGPGSGNWAHEGLDGRHGGSDPGGGIGTLGLEADSTPAERREVARTISAWRPIGYMPQIGVIESARIMAGDGIKNTAKEEGVSEAEVVTKVKGDLDTILKESPISVRRTFQGAAGILDDGRFKSQFETGTSGGAFAPYRRKEAEFWGLGATNELPDKKRPIYGYVATEKADRAYPYGPIEFVLKERVKDRTTITFGDSLGRFDGTNLVGAPVRSLDTGCWDRRVWDAYVGDWRAMSYIEAQIHGGVSLQDVEKVVFHVQAFSQGTNRHVMKAEYAAVFSRAQELGLEVEIDRDSL